jgi:hypothetical protein
MISAYAGYAVKAFYGRIRLSLYRSSYSADIGETWYKARYYTSMTTCEFKLLRAYLILTSTLLTCFIKSPKTLAAFRKRSKYRTFESVNEASP